MLSRDPKFAPTAFASSSLRETPFVLITWPDQGCREVALAWFRPRLLPVW